MGEITGRPVRGVIDSADASSGVAFTLYEEGSLSAYTLGDNEYLEIHHITVVSAAGGDVHVFVGDDASAGTGETVIRGEVASNGGFSTNLNPPFAGQAGQSAYINAPTGNVDAQFRGTIRQAKTGTARPAWRESNFGA